MEKVAAAVASVIWEKCEKFEKCVRIFGQKICISVSACLRLIKKGNRIVLQVEAAGRQFEFEIGDACHVIYSVGIGHIQVCIQPRGGNGVRLQVKGCIAAVGQCWDLWGTDINWLARAEIGDLSVFGLDDKTAYEDGYLAVEDEFQPAGLPCRCTKDD